MSFLPGMFPAVALAGGAFPLVMNTAITESTTISEANTINLPSGIVAGELLVVIKVGSGTNQTQAGWTKALETATTGRVVVYYREADGSEGSTQAFSVQSGNTTLAVGVAYRIKGGGALEGTADAGASGAVHPNPPSHTASWGAVNNLWIAGFAGARTVLQGPITSAPSGYGGLLDAEADTGLTTRIVGSAHLQSATATQDPGQFTLTSVGATSNNGPVTIVIRPG